jgi:hypothetical protein
VQDTKGWAPLASNPGLSLLRKRLLQIHRFDVSSEKIVTKTIQDIHLALCFLYVWDQSLDTKFMSLYLELERMKVVGNLMPLHKPKRFSGWSIGLTPVNGELNNAGKEEVWY